MQRVSHYLLVPIRMKRWYCVIERMLLSFEVFLLHLSRSRQPSSIFNFHVWPTSLPLSLSLSLWLAVSHTRPVDIEMRMRRKRGGRTAFSSHLQPPPSSSFVIIMRTSEKRYFSFRLVFLPFSLLSLSFFLSLSSLFPFSLGYLILSLK